MTGPTPAVRRQVIERDQGRCVVTGAYLVDPDTLVPYGTYSLHHRRPRGMGGSKDPATNNAANLLLLSGSGTTGAHGWIESNRQAATDMGFLVPQWQDPELVPVTHWLLGLAFPTADGWAPIPPGPEGLLAVADRALALATARGLAKTDEGFTHIAEALHEMTHDWIEGRVA